MKKEMFILLLIVWVYLMAGAVFTFSSEIRLGPAQFNVKFFYENIPTVGWKISAPVDYASLKIPTLIINQQPVSQTVQLIKHDSSTSDCEFYYFEFARTARTITYNFPLADAKIIDSKPACLYDPKQFILDSEAINSLGGIPLSQTAYTTLLSAISKGQNGVVNLNELCTDFNLQTPSVPSECLSNPQCNVKDYCPQTAQCLIEVTPGEKASFGVGYYKKSNTVVEDNEGKPISNIESQAQSFLTSCTKSGGRSIATNPDDRQPDRRDDPDNRNTGVKGEGISCGEIASPYICGDREDCEASGSGGGCSQGKFECKAKAECGNGIIDEGEECDSGKGGTASDKDEKCDSSCKVIDECQKKEDGESCKTKNGKEGFCKKNICTEKTCESVYGADFSDCGGGGYPNCCQKGKCCKTNKGNICCNSYQCNSKDLCLGYGPAICEPLSSNDCPSDAKKFCQGECWNWCCPVEKDCIVTTGITKGRIADCGRSGNCKADEVDCSETVEGWNFVDKDGKTAKKCCNKEFEYCTTNKVLQDYPWCNAKEVVRAGYSRCKGTKDFYWQSMWCAHGSVCTNYPNGAVNCVRIK